MTTKLTPATPEQILLIREAARQVESGEWAANYWIWQVKSDGKWIMLDAFPAWVRSAKYRFIPALTHPHYSTYCEWQRLVGAGEVGNGWWELCEYASEAFTVVVPDNCHWTANKSYQITKCHAHPDNVKPKLKLKLIDWSKLVGCETSEGTLLGFDVFGSASVMRIIGVLPRRTVVPAYTIRLVEQHKFTHLPAGTLPPVIEGLVIEYEYWISISGTLVRRYGKDYTLISNSMWVIISAYRIVGIDRANGWTDNPELIK